MAKIDQNFSLYSGDSRNLVVSVVDDAGVAVDLTGAVIKWILFKTQTGSGAAEVSKSSSLNGGITVAQPLSGQFTVSILPADTQNLAGSFVHSAQVTDARNNVSVVMSGKVTVNQMRKFQ